MTATLPLSNPMSVMNSFSIGIHNPTFCRRLGHVEGPQPAPEAHARGRDRQVRRHGTGPVVASGRRGRRRLGLHSPQRAGECDMPVLPARPEKLTAFRLKRPRRAVGGHLDGRMLRAIGPFYWRFASGRAPPG